ncbi:hypothetical protein P2G88_17590 [Aliiglaciecola sp. CAU 1673]|uniref:hypothetical protein n=1 Tax=Aliiglaciecola sp. CAU 1673 TaxID=3032595 RepID=UPI0023DA4B04|nr:hypothetical protein [Aliiglaciecola sp. CAU 1673]MDF2180072.1 hypothetical protein [Aliiglaciecola sp. CAU 1673]
MSYKNIEYLMSGAFEWVNEWDPLKGGQFIHTSLDGGEINLRVGDICHDGMYYRALKLMHIVIPDAKRELGLYSFFIHRLEDKAYGFGAIWHDRVENHFLIERHSRYKLKRRGNSFYKILGEPHPKHLAAGISWLHPVMVGHFQ